MPAARLAGAIGQAARLRSAPPGACRHHPLVPAYGWPLARLARALAPPPLAKPGPAGLPLVAGRLPPLPARELRRRGRPAPDRLGAADDRLHPARRPPPLASAGSRSPTGSTGPALGWERVVRRATQADVEAARRRPVLLKDDPALVPLETLPGRDHYDFPAGELPPWRWNVRGRYPGWSS